jgi:hypothetical protein
MRRIEVFIGVAPVNRAMTPPVMPKYSTTSGAIYEMAPGREVR